MTAKAIAARMLAESWLQVAFSIDEFRYPASRTMYLRRYELAWEITRRPVAGLVWGGVA